MIILVSSIFLCAIVTGANSEKVGIIHMHGVLEGYFDHNNFKKFIERETGIPVHLLDVSLAPGFFIGIEQGDYNWKWSNFGSILDQTQPSSKLP